MPLSDCFIERGYFAASPGCTLHQATIHLQNASLKALSHHPFSPAQKAKNKMENTYIYRRLSTTKRGHKKLFRFLAQPAVYRFTVEKWVFSLPAHRQDSPKAFSKLLDAVLDPITPALADSRWLLRNPATLSWTSQCTSSFPHHLCRLPVPMIVVCACTSTCCAHLYIVHQQPCHDRVSTPQDKVVNKAEISNTARHRRTISQRAILPPSHYIWGLCDPIGWLDVAIQVASGHIVIVLSVLWSTRYRIISHKLLKCWSIQICR